VDAGPTSATSSSLTASPVTVLGLNHSSTITITAKDAYGNLAPGEPVRLDLVGSTDGAKIPTLSPTNLAGISTGELGSTTGGIYQVRAVVGDDAPVSIDQTQSVTFLLTFKADIEPLFSMSFATDAGFTASCASCHLPYKENGNLPNLGFDQLTQVYDGKPVVQPGDPDASLIILALEHDPSLPPSKHMPSAAQRLPEEVINKIRRWIDQEDALRKE